MTTARLTLAPDGRLRHRIGLDEISNDLAGWIVDDLVTPGLLAPAQFEPTFVSIVQSVTPDPGAAWTAFYRNTLDALATGGAPGGTNAGMAPVHQRAAELAIGDVLELGCCFGFLSLRLAARARRDRCRPVAGHRRIAGLGRGGARCAATGAGRDALAVPLADRCADTVFAVHLLEHLSPGADELVLAQMLRLARRRVVIAVPYEDEPNPTWGHLRTFDTAALRRLGGITGRPYQVTDHHGGWLVVDSEDRGWSGRLSPDRT